jgi:hypothetical protein
VIHPIGHDPSTPTIPTTAPSENIQAPPEMPATAVQPVDIATRAKLRARQHFQQNRFVIIGAGALVFALLVFVATSVPHKSPVQKTKVGASAVEEEPAQTANAGADRSLFPITDSGRPFATETHDGFLNEKDLERSVTPRPHSSSVQAGPTNPPGTLGSIPPFGQDQPGWQAPPYQAGAAPTGVDAMDLGKAEREAMEKSSLIYVRNSSASVVNPQTRERMSTETPEINLGLSTGTRLRARLESAASTAVRAPVLAVVEYTYERDGQIVWSESSRAHSRGGSIRLRTHSI